MFVKEQFGTTLHKGGFRNCSSDAKDMVVPFCSAFYHMYSVDDIHFNVLRTLLEYNGPKEETSFYRWLFDRKTGVVFNYMYMFQFVILDLIKIK